MALKHMIIGRKHGKADFDTAIKLGSPNEIRPVLKKYLTPPQEDPDFDGVQLTALTVLRKIRLSKPSAKKPAAPEVKPEAKKPAEEPKTKTVHFTPPIHRPAPTTHRTPVK